MSVYCQSQHSSLKGRKVLIVNNVVAYNKLSTKITSYLLERKVCSCSEWMSCNLLKRRKKDLWIFESSNGKVVNQTSLLNKIRY